MFKCEVLSHCPPVEGCGFESPPWQIGFPSGPLGPLATITPGAGWLCFLRMCVIGEVSFCQPSQCNQRHRRVSYQGEWMKPNYIHGVCTPHPLWFLQLMKKPLNINRSLVLTPQKKIFYFQPHHSQMETLRVAWVCIRVPSLHFGLSHMYVCFF